MVVFFSFSVRSERRELLENDSLISENRHNEAQITEHLIKAREEFDV